jgi:hypothetical protein
VNSVKNAIVTMTLLAVGYGAYVVLSNPVPEDVGDLADASAWQAPEVTTPATEAGLDASVDSITEPPPLGIAGENSDMAPSADQVALPDNSAQDSANPSLPSPAQSADNGSEQPATSVALPGHNNPAATNPAAQNSPLLPDTRHDVTVTDDSNANYYVSRSTATPPNTGTEPATAATDPTVPASNGPVNTQAQSLPTAASGGFESAWLAAQADLQNGQLGAALGALSAWYDNTSLTKEQQDRLTILLDQLAGTVLYSRDSFLESPHVVQQGETLQGLAQQYQVPVDFLARINGVDPPLEVAEGESIKVLRGPFRAEISRGRGVITLFLGPNYAGRFQARIGAEVPSDENTYTVVAVEPGLEFFDSQTGNRIGRGHPDNPYGSVWISLRGNQITAAHNVGIHVDRGDPKRCSIGVSEVDAHDLAAILGSGSTIHVKP